MIQKDTEVDEFVGHLRAGAMISASAWHSLTAERAHIKVEYSPTGGISEDVYRVLLIGTHFTPEEKHDVATAVLENRLYRRGVAIAETCMVPHILAEFMEYGSLPELVKEQGFSRIADQLFEIILQRRTQRSASPFEKPDWDSTPHILFYRGRGVPVDPGAYRMRPVLDSFQAHAWQPIPTPFQRDVAGGRRRPDMPLSYQTIKDLNRKFKGLLCFRVVGPTMHWFPR